MVAKIKVPLIVVLVMLLLGFIGVVLTDVLKDGAWQFWRILTVIYALLSLALNAYLRKKQWRTKVYHFWHELWHWIGLILCISVISFLVKIGLISRFLAGLEILILLALSTYLIGVYIEVIFIPVGILLGIFAVAIAFFEQYLYAIAIPLILITAGIIFWIVHKASREKQQGNSL